MQSQHADGITEYSWNTSSHRRSAKTGPSWHSNESLSRSPIPRTGWPPTRTSTAAAIREMLTLASAASRVSFKVYLRMLLAQAPEAAPWC